MVAYSNLELPSYVLPIFSLILNSTQVTQLYKIFCLIFQLNIFMLTSSYLVTLVTSNNELNFLCEIPYFEPHLLIEFIEIRNRVHHFFTLQTPCFC